MKIKREDVRNYIFMLLFTCVVCLGYLIEHFSSDSFLITRWGYRGYAINYSLLDGRPFMALILLLADKCNIPITMLNRILLFLAIVVSTMVVIKLKNIILRYKKIDGKIGNALLLVACYYTIYHFFYIDNLYFAEDFVMAISLFLYITAADYIVDKKAYIKATILLVVGVLSYQATISMFFVSIILISILNGKGYKFVLKNFLIAVALSFIAIIVDFIEIMAVQRYFGIAQKRLGSNMLVNIAIITFYAGKSIVITGHYFPIYLFVSFIIIVQTLIYYKTIRYNRCKSGERILLEQLILIIACITLSFIPSILSLTAFESGRIRFSMGATIGVLFIHILAKDDLQYAKSKVNRILILVLIAYAVCNSMNYIYLININGKVNRLDQKYALQIGEYIDEYEKQNNVQVNKIAIVLDKDNNKKYYAGLNYRKVGIAISSLRTEWAVDGVINYYTERSLERTSITEEEKEVYYDMVDKQRDYICIGDTLYISVYHK